MGEARVEFTDYATVSVEFPYDAEALEQLKAEVPPEHRTWNASRKVWEFTPRGWNLAVAVLEQYFDIVE